MSSSFADTRWSLVERSRGEGETARVALSELCAAYYSPVHRFVLSWCRDEERAKDLTQDFFARVLAEQSLTSATASRGRFRSYLLGAVKHFLCASVARENTRKRGQRQDHIDFNDDDIASADLPPDLMFDHHWALTAVHQALTAVQLGMEAEGKGRIFDTLKPWLAGQADHGQTREAATALGVSETAVRVLLHRLRTKFREALRSTLAQTLADATAVDQEMECLVQALRGSPSR